MSRSPDRCFSRLNVAFLCNTKRGVYMPMPQSLACEFRAPHRQPTSEKQDGILGDHPSAAGELSIAGVSSVTVTAEGDPYAPDDHDRDKGLYSLDGYAPECAYEMANSFLGCVVSGYELSVTVTAGGLIRDVASPRWQRGNNAYWADTVVKLSARVELITVRLAMICRRGIQTKGGAFSGMLPDILVLPVIVTVEGAEASGQGDEDA